MPLHGHVTWQGGLAEDQMHSGVHVHVKDLKVSAKEDKLKRDNSSQKMNEPEKNRSLESEVVFQGESEGFEVTGGTEDSHNLVIENLLIKDTRWFDQFWPPLQLPENCIAINKNPTSPEETDNGNAMHCISKSERVIQILQLPCYHVLESGGNTCCFLFSFFWVELLGQLFLEWNGSPKPSVWSNLMLIQSFWPSKLLMLNS